MKKLFLSTVALLLFSASVLLFQLSCKKDATAQSNSKQQIGKILYLEELDGGRRADIWIANYDGSNATKVNYLIPQELSEARGLSARLSPDGKTVFIQFTDNQNSIYSCNVDGSDMKRVISGNIHLADVL